MQTSTSICCTGDCCHVAAVAQLQRPILDGTFPRARCLVWLTATLLTLLIAIQLTGAPAL